MKERLLVLLKTYILFVLIFIFQKPLFMGYYHELYGNVSLGEWFNVPFHGLPLDFSMAGYLTVIPAFLLLFSVWTNARLLFRIQRGYFWLISFIISLTEVVDLNLYKYWGFRLDATPLFYFFSSPKDAFASAGPGMVIGGVFLLLVLTLFNYLLFYLLVLRGLRSTLKMPFRPLRVSAVMLVASALLFIPIRGGFSVATMNTGQAYYSVNQRLNHAAVNPLFSVLESLSKQNNFAEQYRFMDEEKANAIFAGMLDPEVSGVKVEMNDSIRQLNDSLHSLFTTKRPDVYIIIMESFSSRLMKTLTAREGEGVAVNLDSLSREGILFTNFYANSFRTDRGVVSVLSGYPAQPTTSIMKYTHKSQTLPSIAMSLRNVGYDTHYYYGGDANFTNMRSYVMGTGFSHLVSDVDFPISKRRSKWGVHDHLVFRYMLNDMRREAGAGEKHVPQLRVLQTSSSHEPFEVPYQSRLTDNKRLNAFAYTDSVVGDFIRRFKKLPQWKNSVVIMVPDHLGAYPEVLDNLAPWRYQIPLLMVGGAVKSPVKVDVYGSQQDIAATLLAQLGINHKEFTFSKDMFNPMSPHFAFFTFPDAFGMVNSKNRLVYDNQGRKIVVFSGENREKTLEDGEAYLQKLYDDLAKR